MAFGLLALPLAPAPVFAQSAPAAGGEVDLESLDARGLNELAGKQMQAGNWQAGLQTLDACIAKYGEDAMLDYGPVFGITWYRKGFCELKLKRWEDAMKSFETCYTQFPVEHPDHEGSRNVFNKQALLRWGEAAQGAEQYEKAIELYQKYLAERDKKRDQFEPGAFFVQLSLCHFKLGQVEQGLEHFETALKNRVAYRTPEPGIMAGFQALGEAAIQTGKAEIFGDFINRYRGDVALGSYEAPQYLPIYVNLAGQALNGGQAAIAMMIYQLIPSTQVVLADLEELADRLGPLSALGDGSKVVSKEKLAQSRANLEKSLEQGEPHEAFQLNSAAFIHENNGNLQGAQLAYLQLVRQFPKNPRHETHFFHLVRTASALGDIAATTEYGGEFLKKFPSSEHVRDVRRMMLTSLFYTGQYEEVIAVASQVLPDLEKGSEGHDLALHVLAGSRFYTGDYRGAEPLLDEHFETYPESNFRQATAYFRASNAARLQNYAEASKRLQQFLEAHPDPASNPYLPFALFDLANARYMLDENDAALELLSRVEAEFSDSEVLPMSLNLRGNILVSKKEQQEAEKCYRRALELAEARENRFVASEALNSLIGLLAEQAEAGQDNLLGEVVILSDRYWKDFSEGSPFNAQVAVAQVPGLRAAGRGEEALGRLREVIAQLANEPGAVGLEAAIGSHTELYLEEHDVEQLKELYYDFPGVGFENRSARALLRIAIIGVYEGQLAKVEDGGESRIRAEAGIKVLFNDLRNEFDLKDLSPFIMVSVGDFIRGTKSPREALPYYTEVLERGDLEYLFKALFGRGAVLMQGGGADLAQAILDFRRIINESSDKKEKDAALFSLVEAQRAKGDHADAKDNALIYLKDYGQRKPEMALMLGQVHEALGDEDAALGTYLNTWSGYKGAIRISAPALKRYMEMLWQRNAPGREGEPSGRQGAYNAGRGYIDQTRRLLDQMTPEEKDAWREVEQLVEKYVADPDVKSKEELEAEAR